MFLSNGGLKIRTQCHVQRFGHFDTFNASRVKRSALICRASSVGIAPNHGSEPPSSVWSPFLRLAAFASRVMHSLAETTRRQAIEKLSEESLNVQIKENISQMRALALVAPFAAVSGGGDTFFIITKAVASFIKLYLLLLFVRVLLSWFPTFTWWEQQPWLALRQVTDPYLKLFSGLVPPLLGTIDLTPLFGFFILQFLAGTLDVADEETMFWS